MFRYALAAIAVGCATPVLASPIQVDIFSPAGYAAALGGDTYVVEDFETGFSEGNYIDGTATKVGSFHKIGSGDGSGGTVTDVAGNFAGNDGSKLAIRDGNVYGRISTTTFVNPLSPGPGQFLDSNDTAGIKWTVSNGGSLFSRVVFTMTDATDVGAVMRISAAGVSETFSLLKDGSGKRDGNIQTVSIDFGKQLKTASILFENFKGGNYKLNDGFSLDDIAVNVVPLPAAAWMLIAGVGALGVAARKKSKAA